MAPKPKDPFPCYCIVGARPVKAIKLPDGGVDILGWDWDKKDFVRDMGMLTRVMMPEGETEMVTEAQFESYVAKLREKGT